MAWGVATNADLDDTDETARAEMRAVREAAELAPLPAPESIYEDIFAP